METLRRNADEASARAEELQSKVKALEQENLNKDDDIRSLQNQNQMLADENAKLVANLKEAKTTADESAQQGTQIETLQRRIQLLEDEAEEADKNLRETNDKYVLLISWEVLV